jgi:hypothetical protein
LLTPGIYNLLPDQLFYTHPSHHRSSLVVVEDQHYVRGALFVCLLLQHSCYRLG